MSVFLRYSLQLGNRLSLVSLVGEAVLIFLKTLLRLPCLARRREQLSTNDPRVNDLVSSLFLSVGQADAAVSLFLVFATTADVNIIFIHGGGRLPLGGGGWSMLGVCRARLGRPVSKFDDSGPPGFEFGPTAVGARRWEPGQLASASREITPWANQGHPTQQSTPFPRHKVNGNP